MFSGLFTAVRALTARSGTQGSSFTGHAGYRIGQDARGRSVERLPFRFTDQSLLTLIA
jgi:hypothetical protein